MRQKFKGLSDRFALIETNDDKGFLDFFEKNRPEIEKLTDFESEQEIQLAIAIYHTHGRSLLYSKSDFQRATSSLKTALRLLEKSKTEFNNDLKSDVWYVQTLYHLQQSAYYAGHFVTALRVNSSLLGFTDSVKDDEKIRRKIYWGLLGRLSNYALYFGLGFVAVALIFQFLAGKPLELIRYVGRVLAITGLIGVVTKGLLKK